MTTNAGIKWRLAALGSAVALMGVLIALITLDSQRRAGESRRRLDQVDAESFRIADLFKEKLRHANDHMRRYATAHDDLAWRQFLEASKALEGWIAKEISLLPTAHEHNALKDMVAAYTVYEQRAQDLHRRMEAVNEPSASLAEYNSFFEQSRRLNDLGEQLARAHYESRNPMLAHARQTLARLRYLVLALVGLLFVFSAALAAGVYLYLIAPLRVKLVESRALAERNEKLASLGLLAAGIAHEIRTPLTAIKTALFVQQRKLKPESPEHSDALLIERELSRLERIVTEFLHFARPAQPKRAAIDADVPLQEVETLLAPQLAASDIRLVHETSPSLRIEVDAAQIKEALLNLVQNAADSIGRSGTITLRARADRKRLANADTAVVVLEVADTGQGIPPEVEKRLFDPFFTTKDNGTGLGLCLAARIVEVNGGALQYQTQVNRGSTFGIVLPRAA